METFIEPKRLVANPQFAKQRQRQLASLNDAMIDAPIIDVIHAFNRSPHCFTLQCCYGHFLYNEQQDPYNFEPLSRTDSIDTVHYKIAYIAFCVENSAAGKNLLGELKKVTRIDPDNIQFCCAEWFWERQVNSYALQVEPDRFKHEDTAVLHYEKAIQIEKVRYDFFTALRKVFL